MHGSYVPLITPFDCNGEVDLVALEKLVLWHIQQGTDGIVVSATTGEGPSLSEEDREQIAKVVIQTTAGQIPVVVSTGTCCTKQSISLTERALKLGANACLVVTPYYNKPTQLGCIAHYREVAKVGLPVIVYHNPARAVIRLTYETICTLSQIPNICAIKESSYDIELVRKIHKVIPVFSGDDDITLQILQAGGVGSIATSANVIPRGWKKMVALALKRKWDEAHFLQKKFLPLSQAMFLESNPQCVKFALSWLKLCKPILRLPMMLPEKDVQKRIKEEILKLALPFGLSRVSS